MQPQSCDLLAPFVVQDFLRQGGLRSIRKVFDMFDRFNNRPRETKRNRPTKPDEATTPPDKATASHCNEPPDEASAPSASIRYSKAGFWRTLKSRILKIVGFQRNATDSDGFQQIPMDSNGFRRISTDKNWENLGIYGPTFYDPTDSDFGLFRGEKIRFLSAGEAQQAASMWVSHLRSWLSLPSHSVPSGAKK